jgi:phosphatidate cytidylyltransferase
MTQEPGPRRTPFSKEGRALTRAELQAQVRARKEQFDEASEKIAERTGRNLISAIAIGVGLGALLIVSLVLIKEIFLVLAAALLVFGTLELASALRHAGRRIPRIPTAIGAVAVVPAAYYWGEVGQWLFVLAAIAFVTLWRLIEIPFQKERASAIDVVRDLSAGVFVQAYVTFLASTAVLLLSKPGGQWWVLGFIISTVLVDVGAYASGLNFGKHPMAPTISPKKTWEGLAGAVIICLVGSVIIAIFLLQMPWWFGLVFGAVIVVTATVGDLAESLLKRDIGIKDMSSWLPGHGGLLDRLDSILPSAAAAYVLYVLFV